MNDFGAWIGFCQISNVNERELGRFQCFVAVFAESADDVEMTLKQYLEKHSQYLVEIDNVFPIMGWLNQYGHNPIVMDLAKKVSNSQRVAFGPSTKLANEPEPTLSSPYLTVTEYEISPLADQSNTPLQYKEWIAPKLKAVLFDQSEQRKRLRTYFIVDPTLRKKVVGEFDLDNDRLGIPLKCLFKGDKGEELKEAAPYLLEMTLPEEVLGNFDHVPSFHKDFFGKFWGQDTGIFIRTTAMFDEVLNHFRRFTKVQMEADKRWVFFRFWDPRTISTFLEVLDENDANKFMASFQIINPAVSSLTTYQITNPVNEEQYRTLPALLMKDKYIKAFSEYRMNVFIAKLDDFVSEQSDTFAKLDDVEKKQRLYEHVKESNHFNIKIEQAVANFVLASVQFGKKLTEEPKFLSILESEQHELDRSKALLREVAQLAE